MSAGRRTDPPAWLVQRPIAHRGFHDRSAGRIENSLTAARAALDRGYAIECDVRRSADGEALMFHDATLARLTGRSGMLADLDRLQARDSLLRGSNEGIPSLPDLFELVGGAVPIVCEIKSQFDGDMRLAERTAGLGQLYPGPLALKSFDPAVLIHLRRLGVDRPLGIITEASFDHPEWTGLAPELRRSLIHMLHIGETEPDFLSFRVDDLPHAVACLMRDGMGLPVMAWTVRTPEQRQIAARWADQIVFEGFAP